MASAATPSFDEIKSVWVSAMSSGIGCYCPPSHAFVGSSYPEILNVLSGEKQKVQMKEVRSCCTLANPSHVACGHNYGEFSVVDVTDGTVKQNFKIEHSNASINRMQALPANYVCCTTTSTVPQEVWIVSLRTQDVKKKFGRGSESNISQLLVLPGWRCLVGFEKDGIAIVYDCKSGAPIATLAGGHPTSGYGANIVSLAQMPRPKNHLLITGDYKGGIAVWDARSDFSLVRKIEGIGIGRPTAFFGFPNGQLAVGDQRDLCLVDIDKPLILSRERMGEWVSVLADAGDGKFWMAAGSYFKLWKADESLYEVPEVTASRVAELEAENASLKQETKSLMDQLAVARQKVGALEAEVASLQAAADPFA